MNVLAVIPARGGSKGIRRKNLRLLGGKPLIYYAIQNALKSKFVTDVVVTSDDDDILSYASRFNVYLRRRPIELALDNVTLDPVVYDAVVHMENRLRRKYDIVITLQPTSPLLTVDTLDKAIKFFIKEGVDTLIAAVDATHLYWKEEHNRIIPDYTERFNRQWLPKRYRETGAFLITKREFVRENSRFGKDIRIYVLDDVEGLDIDTPIDWMVAETLMKRVRFVFVVNGNKDVGMGHVYRTIAIANQLIGHDVKFVTFNSDEKTIRLIQENGYHVIKTVNENLVKTIVDLEPSIVINDILDTTADYIRSLKEHGMFVVNFEDLGEGADEAHLVFNALYEKNDPPPNHKYGYKYECLNELFLYCPPISFRDPPKTLLITFGGVDQNNLTCKVLSLVPELVTRTPLSHIIVVIGPGYIHLKELQESLEQLKGYSIEFHQIVTNMPKLMNKADIAVTSNGRTVYELAAMGIPTISIAQNERETLHLFARYHKGVRYLGLAYNLDQKAVLEEIVRIANDRTLRLNMHKAQIEVSKIIREGTDRVVNEILHEYWRWRYEKDKDW